MGGYKLSRKEQSMKYLTSVQGAPDIPEQLLREHEEGRVAFFCGAGISYSAKLLGFQPLVLCNI
jgi:hypothetical protein